MKHMLRIERCRGAVCHRPLSIFSISVYLCSTVCLAQIASFPFPGDKPPDIPQAWKRLIGEYGPEQTSLIVLEKSGQLVIHGNDGSDVALQPVAHGNFVVNKPSAAAVPVRFDESEKDRSGKLSLGDQTFPRRQLGPEEGQSFQVHPSRSIDELRKEALAATPPQEDRAFRAP